MNNQDPFSLRWEEDERTNVSGVVACEEVIYNTQSTSYNNVKSETTIADNDQMAAENLMYLSQDVVNYADAAGVECVTEEVITDDWVVPDGQERVEVPLEHLSQPVLDLKEENDIDVPLPTDQDEYTAMRPWPCDFCSRRFRKKAALMNHMVAHQNDRPHTCNLCGVRYVRKSDLMNHLKIHAYVPDNTDEVDYDDVLDNHQLMKPRKKRGRRKKNPEPVENGDLWENMTSARTQQWSRKRNAAVPPPLPPSPPSPVPPSPPSPPPPADPTRPFVCVHCGVGFAREKALQSHSRIHGGDSPLECSACGELCWSREALAAHSRRRHPDLPPPSTRVAPSYHQRLDEVDDEDDDDMEFRLSPTHEAQEPVFMRVPRGPELFCQHCGVAFQRADLLRRHVAAAHSYLQTGAEGSSSAEHTCDVCGEACADALQLLAHAEGHAPRHRQTKHRLKNMSKSRISSTSSNTKHFPCRECGKVFGSRSSQQIHVRIHTGERPYACRFCWKAFADGGTLRKHERIHTGEKPYACAVCPRAFNQRVVLREHVRSHHSAPDRRASGGPSYCCAVCGRTLLSSSELVQHLIQHCDDNTALRRQPQTGPRKYKRRKRVKMDMHSPASSRRSWSPPPPSPPPVRARAKRRRPSPPPRPRMIHTAPEPRPRTKQVRHRRPPRHPADDLRAIRPHMPESPPKSNLRSPSLSPKKSPAHTPPQSPQHSPSQSPKPSPPQSPRTSPPQSPQPSTPQSSPKSPSRSTRLLPAKIEPSVVEPISSIDGAYRCEMCELRFDKWDSLLLHVPVHI